MGFKNKKFEDDFNKSIEKEFAKYGCIIDTSVPKDINETLFVYTNWRKRFISEKFRKVHFSNELNLKLKDTQFSKFAIAVNQIATNLKQGKDIKPYMSKDVFRYPVLINGVNSNKEIDKQKDRDKLLNAFNIHHLHLGTYVKNPEFGIDFLNKQDEILAIYIKGDDVYFVDIFDHKLFPYKGKIFSTIQKNWEFLLEEFEIKTMVDIEPKCTEDEIKSFVDLNTNVPIEINGKFYILSNLSLGGYNSIQFFEFKNMFNLINNIEQIIKDNEENILNCINQHGVIIYHLQIGLKIEDGLLYFIEEQTNIALKVNKYNEIHFSLNRPSINGYHTFDFNS
jgi:hypothetical protein